MSRAEKVLAGLATLQAEGTLCDVELKAEQQTIPAHKAVLAAATPYFAAMFTGKFKETKSHVVTVKDVTFAGLKSVVECIYNTKSKINSKNIEDILPAAHLLQLTDIVEECTKWMSEKITKNNCFSFLRLAEKYSIGIVETSITDFVLRNFVAVSETQGFTEVSQQALCRYLSSDLLNTEMEEISVYKAARSWILKNDVKDKTVIFEIMKNVRFALIPPVILSEQVFTDGLIDDERDCRKLAVEAMKYHADVYYQPFYEGNLNKPRGKQGILLVPNGLRQGNSYAASNNGTIDFLPVPAFKPPKQSKSLDMSIIYDSMSVVQIKNFLFLFGSKSDGYQNFTMRYDASNDSWMKMDAVPRKATIGSGIACSEDNTQIFLMGGMSVDDNTKFEIDRDKVIAKIYTFDVKKNTWSTCSDLPEGLVYPGVATSRNIAYVTGGISTTAESTDSVYAYDIKIKLWLTKAKMNCKRNFHSLEAVNEKLYAIGGIVFKAGVDVNSVDVYDTITNQWTIALPQGPKANGASSLVIENKIYIIGGSDVRQVSLYDVGKNTVIHVPQKLPSYSGSNVTAFLTLPKLL